MRLIYTTPTTPQQNFTECVFWIIKKKLSELPEDLIAVRNLNSETYLVSRVSQVLSNITKMDLQAARHSYYHELTTILL